MYYTIKSQSASCLHADRSYHTHLRKKGQLVGDNAALFAWEGGKSRKWLSSQLTQRSQAHLHGQSRNKPSSDWFIGQRRSAWQRYQGQVAATLACRHQYPARDTSTLSPFPSHSGDLASWTGHSHKYMAWCRGNITPLWQTEVRSPLHDAMAASFLPVDRPGVTAASEHRKGEGELQEGSEWEHIGRSRGKRYVTAGN